MALLEVNENGLFCSAGGFYIDPWRAVERAVTTHAHSDHARGGSVRYLASPSGAIMLRARLGQKLAVDAAKWGERTRIGDVTVSLHPAGHVLGSAQVRVEAPSGETWVVSGDYKTARDDTAEPFEPVRCDVFITESTFGLPVYRWKDPAVIAAEINAWWAASAAQGRTCVIGAYSLGKAQRVMAMLDASIGPIFAHGAVQKMVDAYRLAGVRLPEVVHADRKSVRAAVGTKGGAMVLCPPTVLGAKGPGAAWLAGLGGDTVTATASGWMQIRGRRRRGNVDRGFVLSDHADWPGLLSAIAATGAQRIGVTHGFTGPMVRFLKEQGSEAFELKTRFVGESGEEAAAEDADGAAITEQQGAADGETEGR